MRADSGKQTRGNRSRWLGSAICLCLLALSAFAEDVSVQATVDQNRIAFGDSFSYIITIRGATGGAQPALPPIDGLTFAGPSTRMSTSWINGQSSQSYTLSYQVQPARSGEFTIPAVEVTVDGRKYTTAPIQIVVEKNAMEENLKDRMFAKIQLPSRHLFVGQTAPLDVLLFVRQDVPLRGLAGFDQNADGLNYKFLQNIKQGSQVINGVSYTVLAIEGAISPARAGQLMFGPCTIRTQWRVEKKKRASGPFDDPFFQPFFNSGAEVRDVPVHIDPIEIDVSTLPEEGRPAGFAGAVGQWKLEVSAQPTEVTVGDPITLTAKVTGDGNIDTVPALKWGDLDQFKTYDPTVKTTRNELGTQGERDFQQALIPRTTNVTQVAGIQFSYFDPVARQYKVARHAPIRLVVRPGAGGVAVVGETPVTAPRARETLGQDIVYLKGDPGPLAGVVPFYSTPLFWTLNFLPPALLLGSVIWKRRADRLRGDVAYARRSRAAKKARTLLAAATNHDEIQHALQSYLGDRINVPSSGITASIVDEQLAPRGLEGALASRVRQCFEECDTARFAGGAGGGTGNATKEKVERIIDELEQVKL